MVQLDKDLLTWLKEKFYTIPQIDSLLNNKSNVDHTHPIDSTLDSTSSNPVSNSIITTELETKAPIDHSSTTTDYGVGNTTKYGHLKLDTTITNNGANPVKGGAIYTALNTKSDTGHTHASLEATKITSGDLDNYKTVGEYYCDNDATAGTLSNCPVSEAFHLSIIKHSGVRQILTIKDTANVLTYERNFSNNAWGAWKVNYNPDSLTLANRSQDGLMSKDDFTKLEEIDTGANRTEVDNSITQNGNNPVKGKAIYTALNGKADKNHASTGTDYGLATTSNYGHTKVINNLEKNEYANGEALSAYQGKVLKDNVDSKASNSHTHTGAELRLGSSGSDANVTIQEAVNSKSPETHDSTDDTYGLGTTSKYGHVKIINDLEHTSYNDGEVLSANQGNVLNNSINTKAPTDHSSTATTYGVATETKYGHAKSGRASKPISITKGIPTFGDKIDEFARSDHTHQHPSYGALSGKPTQNYNNLDFGDTVTLSQVKSDDYGHVKTVTDRSIKIPDTLASGDSAGLMSTDQFYKVGKIDYSIIRTYTTSDFSNGWQGDVRVIIKNGWMLITGEGMSNSSTHSSPVTILNSGFGNQLDTNIYATGAPVPTEDTAIFRVNEQGVLQGRCLIANSQAEFSIMVPVNEY